MVISLRNSGTHGNKCSEPGFDFLGMFEEQRFLVILFNRKRSENICKLIQYSKQKEKWKRSKEFNVLQPLQNRSCFLNAFYKDTKIILISQLCGMIINQELTHIEN